MLATRLNGVQSFSCFTLREPPRVCQRFSFFMSNAPTLRIVGGNPSDRRELVALLRKNGYAADVEADAVRVDEETFAFGRDTVYGARYELRRHRGGTVELTVRELALLRVFAEHKGVALTRNTLLNAVWGVSYFGTTRTLDQHISKLRKKLSDPTVIETLHGVGYCYR